MFKPLDLSKTAREQFVQHAADPKCASCHKVLDPLGLPFEHYDSTGRWVNDDRGMAIDATGSIDGRAFDGVPGLARLLADMPEARACYVEQWLRFSSGKLLSDADKAQRRLADDPASRRRPASSTWWWRWCRATASAICRPTRRWCPGGRRHEEEDATTPKPERRIPRRLSRRALLKGALGAAVALPWLELMRPRGLGAQAVVAPKRFGLFFSPCGTIPENWRPTKGASGAETDFALSPILEPLEPFKNDIVVLRGDQHGVVERALRAGRERPRPGDDAHVDRRRPGQGAGRGGAGQPLPRRVGGRPVNRPAHRRGDRQARRCCRRWSWASRARTRSWRRWSPRCATGASTRTTSTSAPCPSSPSTTRCRSTPG